MLGLLGPTRPTVSEDGTRSGGLAVRLDLASVAAIIITKAKSTTSVWLN